ncbi:uncharacterized protein K441DRAFT_686994 [Cenococcum geophilum 1.58]|uniref:uncharacterized protein n=1 Tax=Cenococcum geophilum 1.58 TaxID=794803 RepID=UPI00358FCEE8|nr:hypothetical protein K441DRAFT_686994 [Cenococcum geophilum 1.58]
MRFPPPEVIASWPAPNYAHPVNRGPILLIVELITLALMYGWNIRVWNLTLFQTIQGRQVSIAGQTLFTDIFFANCSIPNSPASEYWNLFAEPRTCEAEGLPLMRQTCVTVLNDLLVYILPMPTRYQLNLPRWNRVDLMVVFDLGSIINLHTSPFDTIWTHHVVYNAYDVTLEGFYLWIWTAVEVNLGVICGCIPALRPLCFHWDGQTSAYSSGTIVTIGSARQRGANRPIYDKWNTQMISPELKTRPSHRSPYYSQRGCPISCSDGNNYIINPIMAIPVRP